MTPTKPYITILDSLFDGVYFVDMDRRITFWNKASEEITGYKAKDIIGSRCQDNILNHIDIDGRALCSLGCPLFATLIDGNRRKDKVFLQHKEGHRISVYINISPIMKNDRIIGAVEVFSPISPNINNKIIKDPEEMRLNEKSTESSDLGEVESYIAYRIQELKRAKRQFCVFLISIDVDNKLDEVYGDGMEDKLLKSVFKSISLNIRPSDFLRFTADKGFIGVFDINKPHEATLIAEKVRILIEASEVPHELGNLSVMASLGITVAKENDTVGTMVLRAYDLMYRNRSKKKKSKGGVNV